MLEVFILRKDITSIYYCTVLYCSKWGLFVCLFACLLATLIYHQQGGDAKSILSPIYLITSICALCAFFLLLVVVVTIVVVVVVVVKIIVMFSN